MHVCPQPPQLATSLDVLAQRPPQHALLDVSHARLQAPQLRASFCVSAKTPEQHIRPAGHGREALQPGTH
jgi:hypothetical protein